MKTKRNITDKNLLILLLVSTLFGSMVLCYGQGDSRKGWDNYRSYYNHDKPNINKLFELPEGYERTYVDAYSEWLIAHPLKENPEVHYYDGQIKHNNNIYAAVFDYEIGDRDLHHCADAAIYLRATYNYASRNYDALVYSFTNGYQTSYKEWLDGARYQIVKNGTDIVKTYGRKRTDSCKTFRKWLDTVFTYAGTWSIEQYDLENIAIYDVEPGDVFVQGGFPGHAVTVVDVATNSDGHKIFMLAQSYMPAQDQHILLNPATGNVWYSAYGWNYLTTPEYTFESSDLHRWKK